MYLHPAIVISSGREAAISAVWKLDIERMMIYGMSPAKRTSDKVLEHVGHGSLSSNSIIEDIIASIVGGCLLQAVNNVEKYSSVKQLISFFTFHV